MRLIAFAAVASALVAAAGAPLPAQKEKEPRRPKLDAVVDTNDWEAYYQYGMATVQRQPAKAASAFYWASRLNPARAEPYYGQWAATWLSKRETLLEYWRGAEYVVNSGEGQKIDTLLWEATIRNPLLHRGLQRLLLAAVYDLQMGPGNWTWSTNSEDDAWRAYTEGRFAEAAAGWGAVLAEKPNRYSLHEQRAYAFASMQQLDSAIASMNRLVEEMDKRDRKKLRSFYESKAIYLYGIGILNARAGNVDAAREAFARALTEDLSMYMAHGALGGMALAQGDTATAITEYDQAVQINGGDPVLLGDYGLLLLQANRVEDAATVLGRAVDADPWFAQPRYFHAVALDRLGKGDEAAAQYREFIARAPRTAGGQLMLARKRLAEMGGALAEKK